MKPFILLSIGLLSFTSTFAGGPWLFPKKSGFLQFQANLYAGPFNQLFLKDRNRRLLNREVLDTNFALYTELALSDRINIMANIPFKYVSTGSEQNSLPQTPLLQAGSISGFSNFRLGLKYGILDKKLKAAVSVQTSWNTVKEDLDKGLVTGYQSNILGLFAHIGGSINSKTYAFVEGGYQFSSNNFSNFVDIHLEAGRTLSKHFTLIIHFDIRESMNNGSYFNENLRQTGLYPNNQEWYAYGFKGVYEMENRLGFILGTGGAARANLIGVVAPISLSVYKKW